MAGQWQSDCREPAGRRWAEVQRSRRENLRKKEKTRKRQAEEVVCEKIRHGGVPLLSPTRRDAHRSYEIEETKHEISRL
jgi:hypothetical protein